MEHPPPVENYQTIHNDSVMDGHGVASLVFVPHRATCYMDILSVCAHLFPPHARSKVRNNFCGPRFVRGKKVCVGVSNVGVTKCFPNVAQLIGSPLNEIKASFSIPLAVGRSDAPLGSDEAFSVKKGAGGRCCCIQ